MPRLSARRDVKVYYGDIRTRVQIVSQNEEAVMFGKNFAQNYYIGRVFFAQSQRDPGAGRLYHVDARAGALLSQDGAHQAPSTDRGGGALLIGGPHEIQRMLTPTRRAGTADRGPRCPRCSHGARSVPINPPEKFGTTRRPDRLAVITRPAGQASRTRATSAGRGRAEAPPCRNAIPRN